MEYVCPNCAQRTIPGKDKFFASPPAPAKCKACGKFCAESRGPSIAISIVSNVGIIVAFYAAILRFSFVPFVVYAMVLVTLLWLRQRFVPLFPITDAVATGERRLRVLGIVAFLVFIVIGTLSTILWK
jgi:ribosomal protein S27E